MSDTGRNNPGRRGKIERLIDQYDLHGIGDELEDAWTTDEDRMSLRKLAVQFNEELIRSQFEEQNVETITGDVSHIYEILTDDEITSGTRIEVENQLRERGIDLEQLKSDFVTRQAVHTYLRKSRGATHEERDPDEIIEHRLTEINRLKSRLIAVTEQALSTLVKRGQVSLGEFQVVVSIQVQCQDCNHQYQVTDLVNRGGCECFDS